MGQVSRTILSLHKRSGGVLRLKPPFFSSVTMLLSTNPTPNVLEVLVLRGYCLTNFIAPAFRRKRIIFCCTCIQNPILIQPFRYVAPAYIAPASNAIAYIALAYIAPTYNALAHNYIAHAHNAHAP